MSANVTYIRGNIFTSNAQSLVNTVNCVGIMGAGIALEFKYRYPDMYNRYVEFCKGGIMKIGTLYIYDIPNTGRKIINFPTKRDWKHPSKMEFLIQGLNKFLDTYKEKGITSVAFPLLGAQNGGLNPFEVRELMIEYLRQADISIEIYEYSGIAKDDLIDPFVDGILYNLREFKTSTGLSDSQIEKLRRIVSTDELHSLIQLKKIKGVGEEVLKSAFQFAMKSKEGKFTEQLLFQNENKTDFHNIVNGNSQYEIGTKILPIENKSIDQQATSSEKQQQLDNESVLTETWQSPNGNGQIEHLHGVTAVKQDKMEITQGASKTKKRQTTRTKSNKFRLLSMGEKQLLTDLPIEVIERIEANNDQVTIRQLKAYVQGMNLKLKKFVTDKYL